MYIKYHIAHYMEIFCKKGHGANYRRIEEIFIIGPPWALQHIKGFFSVKKVEIFLKKKIDGNCREEEGFCEK